MTRDDQPAAEFRAAGTDLSERRRSGVSTGPLIDLAPPDMSGITWSADGAASIGALHDASLRSRPTRGIAPPIPASLPPRKASPRRRCATLRRSAATSRSVRAAGTIEIRISIA